jgi:hypothetical protein
MSTLYSSNNAIDNIKIVDDFFPQDILEELLDYVYLSSTQWDYHSITADVPEDKRQYTSVVDVKDTGQYVSVLLLDGKTNNKAHPKIVYKINDYLEKYTGRSVELLRVKINRQQPCLNVSEIQVNEPHWDYTCANCTSIVVYLADAIGDTVIYNSTFDQLGSDRKLEEHVRVTPKTNRAVILPSFLLHASSPARGDEERVVVNVIFRFK